MKNKIGKYKGVFWNKSAQKWQPRIYHDGKLLNLGLFKNESNAAKSYNKAAKKLFGEFARLNEVN